MTCTFIVHTPSCLFSSNPVISANRRANCPSFVRCSFALESRIASDAARVPNARLFSAVESPKCCTLMKYRDARYADRWNILIGGGALISQSLQFPHSRNDTSILLPAALGVAFAYNETFLSITMECAARVCVAIIRKYNIIGAARFSCRETSLRAFVNFLDNNWQFITTINDTR